MVNTRDLILGIIGFSISIYGGNKENLTSVSLGILIIFLDIILNLKEQEDDMKNLNNRLDTYCQLMEIKKELEKNKQAIKQLQNELKK